MSKKDLRLLHAFRDLGIAQFSPQNALQQRRLADAYEALGRARGLGVRGAYFAAIRVREQLAEADPANARRQRQLVARLRRKLKLMDAELIASVQSEWRKALSPIHRAEIATFTVNGLPVEEGTWGWRHCEGLIRNSRTMQAEAIAYSVRIDLVINRIVLRRGLAGVTRLLSLVSHQRSRLNRNLRNDIFNHLIEYVSVEQYEAAFEGAKRLADDFDKMFAYDALATAPNITAAQRLAAMREALLIAKRIPDLDPAFHSFLGVTKKYVDAFAAASARAPNKDQKRPFELLTMLGGVARPADSRSASPSYRKSINGVRPVEPNINGLSVVNRSQVGKLDFLVRKSHNSGVLPKTLDLNRDDRKQTTELPDQPRRKWTPRFGGRRTIADQERADAEAIKFIRDEYGPYIRAYGSKLYTYIRNKDPALFSVLVRLKRGKKLPPDLFIPSRDENVDLLIEQAAKSGRASLSGPERRTVTGAVSRRAKKQGRSPV